MNTPTDQDTMRRIFLEENVKEKKVCDICGYITDNKPTMILSSSCVEDANVILFCLHLCSECYVSSYIIANTVDGVYLYDSIQDNLIATFIDISNI